MSAVMIVGEKYWEKSRFDKAEKQYYEMLSQENMYFKSEGLHRNGDNKHIHNCKILTQENSGCIRSNKYDTCDKFYKFKKNCKQLTTLGHQKESSQSKQSLLVSEIAKAREHIKNSLEKMDTISCEEASALPSNILERFQSLEHENIELKKLISNLQELCTDSQKRISSLEVKIQSHGAVVQNVVDDDDGVDLFASDSEEESAEASRIREERLAAYAAKKSKKPLLIAKSSLVLDVKPWDDETDLKEMEAAIRKISIDGLLWGASKFVPVAFGISKLSISCVVEDDKVSIDWLTEEIEKFEKFVQSVDVAAFNKI